MWGQMYSVSGAGDMNHGPVLQQRVPSLPSFSSRPAFPILSCQQGFKCLTTGWRPAASSLLL